MWKRIRQCSSGCCRCWLKRSCSKGRRSAWTRLRWKPTRRCGRLSDVTRESATKSFLYGWRRKAASKRRTREQLAKLDRKRPKKGSNDDWTHPHDPDARITKLKDGRTHLAHKAEHAVDMETGAIVAVT